MGNAYLITNENARWLLTFFFNIRKEIAKQSGKMHNFSLIFQKKIGKLVLVFHFHLGNSTTQCFNETNILNLA